MLLIWWNTNITFITFSDEYNRKMRSKQQLPVISNIEITAALTNFCGPSRNYWQEIHDGPASCSNIRQCQWLKSHTSQNLISSRYEHIWAILHACQACWNLFRSINAELINNIYKFTKVSIWTSLSLYHRHASRVTKTMWRTCVQMWVCLARANVLT